MKVTSWCSVTEFHLLKLHVADELHDHCLTRIPIVIEAVEIDIWKMKIEIQIPNETILR